VDGLLPDKGASPTSRRAESVAGVVALTYSKPPSETRIGPAALWPRRLASRFARCSASAAATASRSYLRSRDPKFIEKLVDVVSLYLDPPDDAVVLSID
jgi:hypothetical protein